MVEKILKLFSSELKVVNIGLEIFNDALKAQGVNSVQVSWEPPPKLEKEYEDILSKVL
ncbi:fdrA domain protein [bacterium]|nr:MAG: fdrA domain protein [bacterium]